MLKKIPYITIKISSSKYEKWIQNGRQRCAPKIRCYENKLLHCTLCMHQNVLSIFKKNETKQNKIKFHANNYQRTCKCTNIVE